MNLNYSRKADLLLIHPPSVFDFQKRSILFGPISDVVPSTPAFEMYPIGFSSIAEHLSRNGIEVRIVNLAYLMVRNPGLDVRRFLSNLKAEAFGISLHWLPHAHGAMELARLLKELHPGKPIILGGYSATYYHEEIIEYPYIDFIVRGDSAERPLLMLMRAIKERGRFEDIPNLVYKRKGEVVINKEIHVEQNLNDFTNDYLNLFRKAVKYRSLVAMTPIYDWWRYPITMIVTCRGCMNNCVICGGSKFATKKYLNRDSVAFRDPKKLADDTIKLTRYTKAPIFIVGDLRHAGDEYAETFIKHIGKTKIENQIIVELFDAASEGYMQMLSDVIPNVNFEISPETHDDRIRKRSGKNYTSRKMEDTIRWGVKYGVKKFDVFFMIGIAGQGKESVMDTVIYGAYLMQEFGGGVSSFIAPLAPFLDPGSIAFERPEKNGYRVLFRKFSDHVVALKSQSWKEMLNYETEWMTRDDIVSVTYEAGKRLNDLKHVLGRISDKTHQNVKRRIERNLMVIKRMAEGRKGKSNIPAAEELIYRGIRLGDLGTVCGKEEIKWPVMRSRFNFVKIGIDVIREIMRRRFHK